MNDEQRDQAITELHTAVVGVNGKGGIMDALDVLNQTVGSVRTELAAKLDLQARHCSDCLAVVYGEHIHPLEVAVARSSMLWRITGAVLTVLAIGVGGALAAALT